MILITTLMVVLFAVFEVQLPEVSTEYSLTNNIAFFLLLNINIILLILLIFLVVRNLVKLIFERKKRILGSRLRVRLVDRKSTRLNSSHIQKSRMPSSA